MCKPKIRCVVDIRRVGSKYEIVAVDPQLDDFPVGSTHDSWDALVGVVREYGQSKEVRSGIGFSATLPAEGNVRDETYREWLRAAGFEFVPEPDPEEELRGRQEVWKGVFSIFGDNPE